MSWLDSAQWGTVPEWLGAIGTVGALFAAVWALTLQRRELRNQIEELKLQGEALTESAAQQGRTTEIQREMLDLQKRDAEKLDPHRRAWGEASQLGIQLWVACDGIDTSQQQLRRATPRLEQAQITRRQEEINSLILDSASYHDPALESYLNFLCVVAWQPLNCLAKDQPDSQKTYGLRWPDLALRVSQSTEMIGLANEAAAGRASGLSAEFPDLDAWVVELGYEAEKR